MILQYKTFQWKLKKYLFSAKFDTKASLHENALWQFEKLGLSKEGLSI